MNESEAMNNEQARCRGTVTFHNKLARLFCGVETCEIASRKDGEVFAIFPNNPFSTITADEIKRCAILEIPDVCPLLLDFDTSSRRARLPEGLR